MFRPIKFVAVGSVCLIVQLALLHLLEPHMSSLLANGLGFLTSAQVNFWLSYYFTWRDRERRKGKRLVLTWLSFMTNVSLGLAINTMVFYLMHHFIGAHSIISAISATGCSAVCTYLVNHYGIFGVRKEVQDASATNAGRNPVLASTQ
jgi:putative flippase GtrA